VILSWLAGADSRFSDMIICGDRLQIAKIAITARIAMIEKLELTTDQTDATDLAFWKAINT
jgi:hypothetical protein